MNLALHADFTRLLSDDPLLAATDHYASCLTAHQPALEFAMEHFSMTAEQLQTARIGYADRSLGKHIPSSRSVAGQQLRSQLIEVGLFKHNGRETLRGYVTQPIVDAGGQLISIRGLKLNRSAAGPSEVVVGRALDQDEDPERRVQDSTANGRMFNAEGAESSKKTDVVDMTQEATQPAAQEVTQEAKPDQSTFEVDGDMIHWTVEDRRYRVGGLSHNATLWSLKVNLLVSRDRLVHVDRIDLVKARSRESFTKAAADALYVSQEIIRRDLGQLLMQLESFQCQRLQQGIVVSNPAEMTDTEREQALDLLRDPQLTGRIVSDLQSCGCIGQSTSKLAIYLAATSRLLPSPLAMVVQSSSAAGRSSLLDCVLSLMPQESTLRLSNLSAQSLLKCKDRQCNIAGLGVDG